MVRDEQGRKMSKSLGNGIDPLEIIKEYGADSLRFSLTSGTAAGTDMRYQPKKVEAARNFCNKVYNASRFVMMNLGDGELQPVDMSITDVADKWILHRLNEVAEAVTANLDSFDLNLAVDKIYSFIWTEFCDWYIEMAKPRLYGEDEAQKANVRAILVHVLKNSMKLLHPFMPFITEDIYTRLPGSEETIMLSAWPKADAAFSFPAEAAAAETAGPGTHAFMAKLVVTCFLVGVAQYIVCFGSLFELFFGILIAGVVVRVVLHGQLAVSLLDLRIGGRFGYSQHFVVITLFLCHNHTSIKPAKAAPAKPERLLLLSGTPARRFGRASAVCVRT